MIRGVAGAVRLWAPSIWGWEDRWKDPPSLHVRIEKTKRAIRILLGLILSTCLISGCDTTQETISPTVTREAKTYSNSQYNFSLAYPSDWIVESESYQSIILVPSKEESWQPSTPSDIPKDPKIRIGLGEHVRERMGPTHFPEPIDVNTLRGWLEERANSGQYKELSERIINNHQAFEITEIRVPGCEKVVYWRPVSLGDLVRISTGCESPYLDQFNQIADSIQQK